MSINIPLFDLSYNNIQIRDYIHDVVDRHIMSSTFILGPDVELFEKKFAGMINCRYSIGVNSGTDALVIALKSLEIGPGDEVITVPNSFLATAQAISCVGAKPVFVDVDHITMNMDLLKAKDAVNRYTKAIIPVHLFGFPVDVFKLRSLIDPSVNIVEDCAQSHGAMVNSHFTGSMGKVNCFSLHPAKILASLGDSGVITTNDQTIYDKCRLLRNFGLINRDSSILIGYNSRLDNLYAAIMYKKIDITKSSLRKRIKNANVYYESLGEISELTLPPRTTGFRSVHNFFVIRTHNRDELSEYLSLKGIETKVHYPIPIHLQECYRDLGHQRGDFPNAESDADNMLTIPVAEHLDEAQILTVSEEIKSYFS